MEYKIDNEIILQIYEDAMKKMQVNKEGNLSIEILFKYAQE